MRKSRAAADRTPVEIYLVRHGETDWSLTGRHTGRTDVALTRRGEDQALALRSALGAIRFDHVLTSPARRARRTCALAGLGAAAEVEPGLAEWNYGDYEGKRSTDIHDDRPGWSVYRDGCPGGETSDDVSDRADRIITRLLALGGAVAVFSHGQFLCSLAVRWIGLPVVHARHFQLSTGALSVLGFNPNHPGLRVIDQWNIQPGRAGGGMGDRVRGNRGVSAQGLIGHGDLLDRRNAIVVVQPPHTLIKLDRRIDYGGASWWRERRQSLICWSN